MNVRTQHSVASLIKYARRAPWDALVSDVTHDILSVICDEADVDEEAILELIGPECEGILFGCVLEHAMTLKVDGVNLVDDYLRRRGWTESSSNRAYLTALRDSTLSLYEVSKVVAGESMYLRDLLRGGEPMQVHETTATRMLQNWDLIATRVLDLDGRRELSGGTLYFPAHARDMVVKAVTDILPQGRGASSEVKREEALRAAAPMIPGMWVMEQLGHVLAPRVPTMVNSDGHEIEFHRLSFPLSKETTEAALRERLASLTDLEPDGDGWVLPVKPHTASRAQVQAEPRTMWARVYVVRRRLVVEVNSLERAERAAGFMHAALGGMVGRELVELMTAEEVATATRSSGAAGTSPPDLSEDEMAAAMHQVLTSHYRKTLDDPIPALGNKSPRQCVRTNAGRQKVADWLKSLEHGSSRAGREAPIASYDFTWMWEELGLVDLRR